MKKIALSIICILTLTACDFNRLFFRPNTYSYSSIVPNSSVVISSSSPSSSSTINNSSSSTELEPYNGYYNALTSWTNGEDLKNQLHTIIRTGYTPLSYDGSPPNYESNIKADHTKFDFEYLDVAYSDVDLHYTQTSKGWQREHAFCASLMCGTTTGNAVKYKGRSTDYHNLFAANASANGSRGNKNYGLAGLGLGNIIDRTTNNGNDGYSYDNINFEPAHKDKGRLARAIFYMCTMYKDDELDTVNNITMKGLTITEDYAYYVPGNNGNYAIGNLSTLLSWNTNYGVDYLEMQHNVSVYQDIISLDDFAQGNRNPYIDFPELVDYVYGDKKNQAGNLNSLVASELALETNEHTFSHYAIKSAKREYQFDTSLSIEDYQLVQVYKDYSYELITTGYSHSLTDHVFSASDGDSVNATISIANQVINYSILLNPMLSTTTGALILNSTAGINKFTPDVDQSVTYGGVNFLLNFSTNYAQVDTNGLTISNIVTNGPGITFGSGTRFLTSLTLMTVASYTDIDAAYIKACVGNTSSSYSLTIKVGSETIFSGGPINNSDNIFRLHGASFVAPKTGQISFIFTGSSSLKLNSIAFNYINA